MVYTGADAFFDALWDAGVTHCFVNLGSDHPALLEAMVKGYAEKKDRFPTFITCPNEMVALSMADGYARLTKKPQCVIVHVDVGTQGFGAAVHNASCGRAPVLMFAGLSPFTIEGELPGSRTEFIHWIQDVPDQKQIVAQYCRYTGEVKTARNIKQLVNRALQWACSDPAGPAYLVAAREVLEDAIPEYEIEQAHWNPIEPAALNENSVKTIADALAGAKEPLVITGYLGRNPAATAELVKLADTVKGLRVLDTGGSDLCFPANHRGWLSVRYGVDESIKTADVILVIDCDVPWIPTQIKPSASAKIFHIDVDPLKQQMPVFYLPALARYRADAFTALSQLNKYIAGTELAKHFSSADFDGKWDALGKAYEARLSSIIKMGEPKPDGSFNSVYLCQQLRKICPKDTIWVIEAVTNTLQVADGIQATEPDTWFNCGSGGLGWSGGAALGIKLASDNLAGGKGKGKFVCQIVGDGTFLFSVPGSVYWICMRYNIPILTIVLNNKGWNAPRNSLLLCHPDGPASKVANEELNISFAPTPDYGGIAKAAARGNLMTEKVDNSKDLDGVLKRAVETVQSGVPAVLDINVRQTYVRKTPRDEE